MNRLTGPLVVLVLACACGGGGGGTTDEGRDTGTPDATADAGQDAVPDTVADTGHDPGVEVGTDVPAELPPDPGEDPGVHELPGADVPDAEDPGPIDPGQDPASDPGPSTDAAGETGSDTVGGEDVTGPELCGNGWAEFNGTTSFGEIPDSDALSLGSSFAIEAWTRFDAPASGAIQYVLSKWGSSADHNEYAIGIWNGRLHCEVSDGSSSSETKISASVAVSALTAGEWAHVACVLDDAADELRLLLDGAVVDAVSVPASFTTANTTSPLYVARNYGGLYLDGGLTELRFYNGPRTADEVRAGMTCRAVGGETGLRMYFPLDPVEGLDLRDGIGSDAVGTLTNVTSGDGVLPICGLCTLDTPPECSRPALLFNDAGDVVQVADFAQASFVDAFTIETWARFDDPFGGLQFLLAKWGSAGEDNEYALGIWADNALHCEVSNGHAAPAEVKLNVSLAMSEIPHGTWTHIACVMDPSTRAMRLLVDGVPKAFNAFVPDGFAMSDTASGLRLGSNYSGMSFKGALSDVRLHSRALRAFEIRKDRFRCVAPPVEGLVALFPLDDGSGTTALEAVGSHSGTLSGAEWITGTLHTCDSCD